MYIDYWYIILVIPAMILALWAQYKVKSTYKKYSGILNSRGVTGAYAAQSILTYYGINDVRIQPIGGSLTDNFDPKTKVISLSQDVYSGNSIAAVGVACHEAGHAAQHAENYMPIKVRNAIIPVTRVGSTIGIPLALIGIVIGLTPIVKLGLLLYGMVFAFQLVTLPVEFNASRRALKVIEETGLLYNDEVNGARKVLSAAAMTYVASMIVALANLLRFIIRFGGSRKR